MAEELPGPPVGSRLIDLGECSPGKHHVVAVDNDGNSIGTGHVKVMEQGKPLAIVEKRRPDPSFKASEAAEGTTALKSDRTRQRITKPGKRKGLTHNPFADLLKTE